MPRRNRPPKRKIAPDMRYNSVLVQKIINNLMRGGKQSTARTVMYEAMDQIEARAKKPALEVLEQAYRNIAPAIEVKPRRVGGSTYQIPVEVPEFRQRSLAIRWLLDAARRRNGRGMADKMSAEILDAAQGVGAAVKKREDVYKMAEANRAFAHLRW